MKKGKKQAMKKEKMLNCVDLRWNEPKNTKNKEATFFFNIQTIIFFAPSFVSLSHFFSYSHVNTSAPLHSTSTDSTQHHRGANTFPHRIVKKFTEGPYNIVGLKVVTQYPNQSLYLLGVRMCEWAIVRGKPTHPSHVKRQPLFDWQMEFLHTSTKRTKILIFGELKQHYFATYFHLLLLK